MSDEIFAKQWRDGVRKFAVLQWSQVGLPGQMTTYVHAEADTGSRYEFLGQEVQIDYRNPHYPTFVMVVMSPWRAVWTSPKGSMIHPNYALEHWSPDGRRVGNGGDAAALTIGLNLLCGSTLEEAIDLAATFFTEEVE